MVNDFDLSSFNVLIEVSCIMIDLNPTMIKSCSLNYNCTCELISCVYLYFLVNSPITNVFLLVGLRFRACIHCYSFHSLDNELILIRSPLKNRKYCTFV